MEIVHPVAKAAATPEKSAPMQRHEFKIIGLDCAEEVAIIKRALAPLEDESNLRFDLLQGKLTVQSEHPAPVLQAAIQKSGMKALLWGEHQETLQQPQAVYLRFEREILCAVSGLGLILGLLTHLWISGFGALFHSGEVGIYPTPSILFFIISIIAGVFHVLPKAWFALRSFRADMHLLMCIAVGGALFLGEYMEAATVSFLFSAALLLETWSVGRARRAVESLLDLSPKTARYICPHDGDIMEKPIAEVPVGVTALLRPGERVPLDGEVLSGSSNVNEAPITGESMPVAKQAGDILYAGSVNLDGSLEFRVDRAANDTQLAHIIHLVREAQGKRAVSEQWVEKFAKVYTPIMLVLAVVLALALPVFLGISWADGIYQAMVVLLIACPCALVISTPVSIVSGLARAARNGVLIKGGNFLELPSQIDVLAFDKTGTLTSGTPSVSGVFPMNGHSDGELLSIAAGIEQHSAHPLAQAICSYALASGVALQKAENFLDVPGKGAHAQIEGKNYWIGSLRFLQEMSPKSAEPLPENDFGDDAQSIVYVGTESHLCGVIAVKDTLRTESKEACTALHEAGVGELALLSGDHLGAVRHVAESLGIDQFESGMLPQDKAAFIKRLQSEGKKVAMVGDGVNDAPAMAIADISIAMGVAGSDTAIETADIALMTDDLRKIAWLVRHSRRSLRIIKQNIVLALGLKLVVLVLVMLGWGALWFAIAADMGGSLLVTFNALRLLRD